MIILVVAVENHWTNKLAWRRRERVPSTLCWIDVSDWPRYDDHADVLYICWSFLCFCYLGLFFLTTMLELSFRKHVIQTDARFIVYLLSHSFSVQIKHSDGFHRLVWQHCHHHCCVVFMFMCIFRHLTWPLATCIGYDIGFPLFTKSLRRVVSM